MALGMGHERNGVSETEREYIERALRQGASWEEISEATGFTVERLMEIRSGTPVSLTARREAGLLTRIRALDDSLRLRVKYVCALESALRQWHEFQCGAYFKWEQCEPCQSMVTED